MWLIVIFIIISKECTANIIIMIDLRNIIINIIIIICSFQWLWIWPLPNTYMYNDIYTLQCTCTCMMWCFGILFSPLTCTCEYLMNLFTALQSLLYIYMYIFCMYLNLKAMPEVYCTCVHLLLTCVCGFYHCCILYSTCTCMQSETHLYIMYINFVHTCTLLVFWLDSLWREYCLCLCEIFSMQTKERNLSCGEFSRTLVNMKEPVTVHV